MIAEQVHIALNRDRLAVRTVEMSRDSVQQEMRVVADNYQCARRCRQASRLCIERREILEVFAGQDFGDEVEARWRQPGVADVGMMQRVIDVLFITDVRFPNEADWVRSMGGVMVRVDRKTGETDNHSTETEMDAYKNYDHTIENNGTMPELGSAVGAMLRKFLPSGDGEESEKET